MTLPSHSSSQGNWGKKSLSLSSARLFLLFSSQHKTQKKTLFSSLSFMGTCFILIRNHSFDKLFGCLNYDKHKRCRHCNQLPRKLF